ncbi:MAG: hypothetical protein Q4D15_00155 [Lachnospiraceae bacterium]|nr:hypothetical protein [Lachnospiraceae bacterium]
MHAYKSFAEEEYIRKIHPRERAAVEVPYECRHGKTLPSPT